MIDKLLWLLDNVMWISAFCTLFFWAWAPEDIIGTKHLAIILGAMLWLHMRCEK